MSHLSSHQHAIFFIPINAPQQPIRLGYYIYIHNQCNGEVSGIRIDILCDTMSSSKRTIRYLDIASANF